MSFHDETPTSELPVVADPQTGAPEPGPEPGRSGWRRLGAIVSRKRIGIVTLAGAVALGVTGIAVGAADTNDSHVATSSVRQHASLPNQTAPRTAPTRASRGDRPTPATPPAAKPPEPKPKAPAWVAPMKGFHINSCYGMRWGRIHQGIDFAVRYGAPIYAVHAGTVAMAGYNSGGYGNMVLIRHDPHLFTLYGHASKVLVHIGQKVKAGQKIALEGATGHVTGPHMHFEVWKAMWQRTEPGAFLKTHGIHLSRCQ